MKLLPVLLLLLTACTTAPVNTDQSTSSISYTRICADLDFQMAEKQDARAWAMGWNTDAAITTVAFESPEKGFSAVLPHNPSWGNTYTNCQLTDYDDAHTHVSFGFANVFEGGGATRFNRIKITAPRTKEAAIKDIRDNQEENMGTEPVVHSINGNTVVGYGINGFCGQGNYEIIGKKHNYVLASICDVDSKAMTTVLESFEIFE